MVVYGAGRWVKHYVSVVVRISIDCQITPLTILWDDGRQLQCETIQEGRRCRCEKTPGYALRFEVLISGKKRYLYRDDAGWFVEVMEGGYQRKRHDPRLAEVPE